MKDYIKLFDTHDAYQEYLNSSNVTTPLVSLCKDVKDLHYYSNDYIIIFFNETSEGASTKLMYNAAKKSLFSEMWIDGVKLPNVENSYKFSTTGIHVVKYKLVNPLEIGSQTFSNCPKIESVILPDTIETIKPLAFENCVGLKNISFNNIKVIENSAFYYCNLLNYIEFPETITEIKLNAFDFTRIHIIYVKAMTPPTLASHVFVNDTLQKIYVPDEALETYRQNTSWSSILGSAGIQPISSKD